MYALPANAGDAGLQRFLLGREGLSLDGMVKAAESYLQVGSTTKERVLMVEEDDAPAVRPARVNTTSTVEGCQKCSMPSPN